LARAREIGRGFFLILNPRKVLAPSGKSPAYIHRRNSQARAGKPVAGFLNRTATAVHGRTILPMQRIAARRVPIELPSEPISLARANVPAGGVGPKSTFARGPREG